MILTHFSLFPSLPFFAFLCLRPRFNITSAICLPICCPYLLVFAALRLSVFTQVCIYPHLLDCFLMTCYSMSLLPFAFFRLFLREFVSTCLRLCDRAVSCDYTSWLISFSFFPYLPPPDSSRVPAIHFVCKFFRLCSSPNGSSAIFRSWVFGIILCFIMDLPIAFSHPFLYPSPLLSGYSIKCSSFSNLFTLLHPCMHRIYVFNAVHALSVSS